MSRSGNIARIAVNGNGEVQASSLLTIPGSNLSGSPNYTTIPSGVQVQCKSTLYQWYNSMTIDNTWYNVPNMSVDITPKSASSKIRIDFRWGGEVVSAWDVVWGITRNGVLINMPTQEGTRNGALGMCSQSYIDDNNDSTPEHVYFSTIDSPGTTNLITYRAVVRAWTSRTLYNGRVFSGTSNGNYEQASQELIVTEYMG